jgi:hypothetical protein
MSITFMKFFEIIVIVHETYYNKGEVNHNEYRRDY